MNKQNKTKQLLKVMKVFVYLLGCETANHVNFMQYMLVLYSLYYFSSLEGDIAEVLKILTSGNKFELVFILYYLLGQFRPVFR